MQSVSVPWVLSSLGSGLSQLTPLTSRKKSVLACGGEGVPAVLLQCQVGKAPSFGDQQKGRERAGLSGLQALLVVLVPGCPKSQKPGPSPETLIQEIQAVAWNFFFFFK